MLPAHTNRKLKVIFKKNKLFKILENSNHSVNKGTKKKKEEKNQKEKIFGLPFGVVIHHFSNQQFGDLFKVIRNNCLIFKW